MSEFKRDIKNWCRTVDLKEYRALLTVEDGEEGPTMTISVQLENMRIALGMNFNTEEEAFNAMDTTTAEQLEGTIAGLKQQMVDQNVD